MFGTKVRRILCWKVASATELEEADVINSVCMTVGSGTLVASGGDNIFLRARNRTTADMWDGSYELLCVQTPWCHLQISTPTSKQQRQDQELFGPSLFPRWVYLKDCQPLPVSVWATLRSRTLFHFWPQQQNTWRLRGGWQVCCCVHHALKYCLVLVVLNWSENSRSDKRSCQLVRNTPALHSPPSWKIFPPNSAPFSIFPPSTSVSLFVPSFPFLPFLHLSFSLVCLACLSRSWWFCVSRGKPAPQQTVSWPAPPTSLWGNSCTSGCGTSEPPCSTSEDWSEEGNTWALQYELLIQQ